MVKSLTWGDVSKYFNREIISKYSKVEVSSKVNLSKFKHLVGDKVVLSKFCGVPSAKRAKLSKSSSNARARGEVSKSGWFTNVNVGDKMSYLSWQMDEIARRRASGEVGKIVIKITREQLMSWTEYFVNEFNEREK